MDKEQVEIIQSRIPEAVDGIQVNFCKNPKCRNFGTPASNSVQPRGRYASSFEEKRDNYKLEGDKENTSLTCAACGRQSIIKSNRGIKEEYDRITAYLRAKTSDDASCPVEKCPNHVIGVGDGKENYQSFGKTKAGSTRYRCKECGKTFSTATSTLLRQNKPYKNLDIFRMIMNGMSFRGMSRVTDLGMWTIFKKIDFIHKQCMAFVANRERKLFNGDIKFERLYISVDCQVYIVNWSNTKDKKNVSMSAVCSADNTTNYVFGLNLNYDPSVDRQKVEDMARELEDGDKPAAHRLFARLWMDSDYRLAAIKNISPKDKKDPLNILADISAKYDETDKNGGTGSFETPGIINNLPSKGMQVHAEYTAYAHFLMLKKLCRQTERVRLFIDQEPSFLGASMAAFANEVMGRDCDIFYTRIKSEMNIHQKQNAVAETKRELNRLADVNPYYTEQMLRHELIKQRMDNLITMGSSKDKWLVHPIATMSEPEKYVCYLTDLGGYDKDHIANLYEKASLQGVDKVFNQIRNMIKVLSRQPPQKVNRKRQYFKESAYNPERVIKLLEIFRVYHNYFLLGKDKRTPAMRLGLAKSQIRLEDILYYKP